MNFFQQAKAHLLDPSNSKCLKLIGVNHVVHEKFSTYTFKIKVKGKRRVSDDATYDKYPELLDILPRGCTVLVNGITKKIIGLIEGPRKFSGFTPVDEDPDNGNSKFKKTVNIYRHEEVVEWAKSDELVATYTSKENGKMCVCRLMEEDDGTQILVAGSKNCHVPVPVDILRSPEKWEQFKTQHPMNPILSKIFAYFVEKIDVLSTNEYLLDMFRQGYTLGGELCDGEHFTPGDNKVRMFGLFKDGLGCSDGQTVETLAKIRATGLDTVDFRVVYDSKIDSVENLEKIFYLGRMDHGEGGVLYLTNQKTGKTVLVKTKAAGYILKRITRQVLLKGTTRLTDIQQRIIDTADYHGLNTAASIRITQKLQRFGMWLVEKKYPTSILDVTEVRSVKGKLQNGFYRYWKEFMDETGETDILVGESDIGEFSKRDYQEADLALYPPRQINGTETTPLVIFTQGIQGSGKSTIGSYCVNKLKANGIRANYYEQDDYWGHSFSCQGAIYHDLKSANGSQVLFITRCNAEPKQYKRYLDIAQKNQARILFFTPEHATDVSSLRKDYLYLAISLAGIIKRSIVGDQMIVGRFEYPFEEVAEFTIRNFNGFREHPQSILYPLYKHDDSLFQKATTTFNGAKGEFETFVHDNHDVLNDLRHDLSVVCAPILNAIEKSLKSPEDPMVLPHYVQSTTPFYVGLFLKEKDRQDLLFEAMGVHGKQDDFISYCHHCTFQYLGGKRSLPRDFPLVSFKKYRLVITELVVRLSDKAMAFSVAKIIDLETGDPIRPLSKKQNLHITAYLPSHLRPVVSNSFVAERANLVVKRIPCHYELETTCLFV